MIEPIREAIKAAISKNPAKIKGEVIARCMGLSTSQLYRFGEVTGQIIPLKHLIQFCTITKDLRPITELNRLIGVTVIPMGADDGTTDAEASLKTLKEASQFLEASSSSMMDDKITAREMARIEDEAQDALLAIVNLREKCRRRFQSQKGAR